MSGSEDDVDADSPAPEEQEVVEVAHIALGQLMDEFVGEFGDAAATMETVQESMLWLKGRARETLAALSAVIREGAGKFVGRVFVCHPRKPLVMLPEEDSEHAAASFNFAVVDLDDVAAAASPETRFDQCLKKYGMEKVVAQVGARRALLFVEHPPAGQSSAPYFAPVAPYVIPSEPAAVARSPVHCTGRPQIRCAVGRRPVPHPLVPDPSRIVRQRLTRKAHNASGSAFIKFDECSCVILTTCGQHSVLEQIGPSPVRFVEPKRAHGLSSVSERIRHCNESAQDVGVESTARIRALFGLSEERSEE